MSTTSDYAQLFRSTSSLSSADPPFEQEPTNYPPPRRPSSVRPGARAADRRPLPSIPGSPRSHTPLTAGSGLRNPADLPSSNPVFGSVLGPYDEPQTPPSRRAGLRQPNLGVRPPRLASIDEPFDEFDVQEGPDRVRSPGFEEGEYGSDSEADAPPVAENGTIKGQRLRLLRKIYPAPDPSRHLNNARRSPPAGPPASPHRVTPPGVITTIQKTLDPSDASEERPSPRRRTPEPYSPVVPQLQRGKTMNPSTSEPRVFYPPRTGPPEPSPEGFPSEQKTARPSIPARSQYQRNQSISNQPPSRPPQFFSPRPPLEDAHPVHAQEPQLNVQPLVNETDEWVVIPPLHSGIGSGRPSPVDQSVEYLQDRQADSRSMGGDGQWSPQMDGPPRRGKEIRRGYYRLYSPSGTLFSINPIYENDISLSSFDVEHVSPPRLARNYIAFISQRESIRPSGVAMYFMQPGARPELVKNLDRVISMDPSARQNLDVELPLAYYRLFGVASSSRGAQRPMPSHHALYEDDLSLTALFIDYVPPPFRAKDYIAYIGQLEGIHPSRITLYLCAKSVVGEIEAEAQEIENPEDAVAPKTASSTSETNPILVNVELEVDQHGNLHFGTKSKPLPSLSIRGITRNHHLKARHSPLDSAQPMTINALRPSRSSASPETHASNPRPLPSIPGSAGVCALPTNGASPKSLGETASPQPLSSLAIAPLDEPMTQTSRSVNLRRATRSAPDHESFDEFDLVQILDRSTSLDLEREPRARGGEVRPITNNATATVVVQAPGVAERFYPESYRSSWLSNARPPPPVNQPPSPPEINPSYNTTHMRLDPSYIYEERPAPHRRIPESPTSAVPQIQRTPPSPPRITSPVVCNNSSSRVDLPSPYGARPAPGQRTPDPATSAVPQTQWMPPSPSSTTSSGSYPHTQRRPSSPNVYGVRLAPGQRTPDPSTSAVPQSQRMTSAGPSTFEPQVFYPPNPTPQNPYSRGAPRPPSNFQPRVAEEDRRAEVSRLRGGRGSGGPSSADPYLEYPQVRGGDSPKLVELPLRSKDIRRGMFRSKLLKSGHLCSNIWTS
ncbi:hypothetical protein FRC04_007093 [Tulasnella sp. 424]|nr:hypothetical protein FRC04_007093 [Tulasnella sp. 424]